MKLIFRVLFVAMICVAVLAQAGRVLRSGEQPGLISATIDAATRLGLTPVDTAPEFPLSFTSAACGEPIQIDVLYLDGRTDEEGHATADPARLARYVYLGSVRDRRDLTAMRARWLLANALFVVGVRSRRPGMEMLGVTIPEACPGLVGLDWARLSPW